MGIRKKFRASGSNCNLPRRVSNTYPLLSVLIVLLMMSSVWVVSASPVTNRAPTSVSRSSNNDLETLLIDEPKSLDQVLHIQGPALSSTEFSPAAFDPITLQTLASITYFEPVQAPHPTIQEMIDQVDQDTIYTYTGGLSGEWPVLIGGEPYTILTRHTDSGEPIRKATEYVTQHLTNLGLEVEVHNWESPNHPNVIGQITGQVNPENIYMITAHLDDQPSGPIAPGADDNASGSVATLIAADILSQYQWGCTLRFALWTGEEQGFEGSEAYADRASDRNENILGVLNLDMIGHDGGGPPNARLFAKSSIPASIDIANLFVDVVQAYNIGLEPTVRIDGSTGELSDNQSFWNEGYAAILAIEGDLTPHYHKTTDTLANLNMDYYNEFVKASVGTFAHMTGCLMGEEPGPTFTDVPFDHWAHDDIEALYQAGFTTGCSTDPISYCPDRTLIRAEGAVFTVRGYLGADFTPTQPQTQVFADTLLTDWPVDWITQLWDDGYTTGCGVDPLIFCPWQAYNRAEGSVFALRMKYGNDYVPPEPDGIFTDVSELDWFIEWVEAAYNEGLIPACQEDPLQFCPFDPLDRAMAAHMTVQAKGLQTP
jgi:hypothetical protein